MSDLPRISLRIRFSSLAETQALVDAAEDLGLHGVWINEPWGHDAGTVLGWIAARTRRVMIGTHIVSVYARTPAATAGLAAGLQVLSGGRFRLGLGASGPKVVEGWHGVPFERPLGRTRDTIAIVRQALRGERVEHQGRSVTVPLPDSRGRPLRFSQLGEPMEVPIYVAALGPANQRLTAKIADGWSPTPYSPDVHLDFAGELEDALDAHGRRGKVALTPVCPVAVGTDLSSLLDLERGWSAFYLGGMGTSTQNFYGNAARRMGRGDLVDEIGERWAAGDRAGARAAVPDAYADSVGLFGDAGRVRERVGRYVDAGIDELAIELRKPDLEDQLDDLRAFWAAVQS